MPKKIQETWNSKGCFLSGNEWRSLPDFIIFFASKVLDGVRCAWYIIVMDHLLYIYE